MSDVSVFPCNDRTNRGVAHGSGVSRQNSIQTLGTIDSCTRNQPWNGFSAAEGTRTNALSCEAVPRGSQRTWQIYFSCRSNSPTLRDVQRISSGCQIVTMMKTSEPWHRCNLATGTGILICLTPAGRSLRQREMRSVFMVITNVFADQAFQMPFVENNHMVKQVPSAIANPTLCNTVLPRTSEAGSCWLDAEALHGVDYFFIEACAAIEDQVFGSRVVGECLAQLLDNPGAGRAICRVAMKDTPPIMGNDEEAVKHAEGKRRYREEVHCCNGLTMIAQKGSPTPCRLRTPRRFPYPALYRALRKIESKHFEFSMNSGRAPCLVLGDHAENDLSQFPAHTLSSCSAPASRKPRPIQLEALAMPANNLSLAKIPSGRYKTRRLDF
jgi:hypothetical protein